MSNTFTALRKAFIGFKMLPATVTFPEMEGIRHKIGAGG